MAFVLSTQQVGAQKSKAARTPKIITQTTQSKVPPIIVNVLPAAKTEVEQAEEADERRKKAELDKKLTDYTGELASFTKGLFAATVALVIATVGLVIIGIRQARDSRDAVVKLQRAFLSLQDWRFLSHSDSAGKIWWSFHFTWKNSGASPALKSRFFTQVYLSDVEMPANFEFKVGETNEIFVGPEASINVGDIGIYANDLLEVRDKKKFLYFWGSVEYQDVFENTQCHVTKFSFQVLNFRGDVTKEWDQKTNAVEIISRTLNRHNCADESCA